ncbi:MAG: M23 family metallopeptidase [Armatimonadota bacterium]|nr:MAG: M23 family metallopeptidase [Armatimonadota bacterium]
MALSPEAELLRAACSWGGKSYRFLASGNVYELVLPVSLTTQPGAYRATLYWKYIDGRMGKRMVPIQVEPREFGVQHLRLSRRQEACYSAPETKREKRLIGAALDRVTSDRWWMGSFVMPVEGRVSTGFGMQRYINGRLAYRHRGIDIAAPEGTPVQVAADGVVSLADDSFVLHGQTVLVDHGHGVSTLYIHLSEIAVTEGQTVTRGEMLGRVGATGVATGPHLHFGVYAYHRPVDPLFWMSLPER